MSGWSSSRGNVGWASGDCSDVRPQTIYYKEIFWGAKKNAWLNEVLGITRIPGIVNEMLPFPKDASPFQLLELVLQGHWPVRH